VGEWFEDVESLKQRKLTASEITVQFQGIARLDRPALGGVPVLGHSIVDKHYGQQSSSALRLRPLLRRGRVSRRAEECAPYTHFVRGK